MTLHQPISAPPATDQTSPPTFEKVIGLLRGHKEELRARFGVSYVGVFGSYVHGENTTASDLDLLVDFTSPPTLFQFVRLQRHLGDILGIPVDLVMKSSLKPAIGKVILSEVVPV